MALLSHKWQLAMSRLGRWGIFPRINWDDLGKLGKIPICPGFNPMEYQEDRLYFSLRTVP